MKGLISILALWLCTLNSTAQPIYFDRTYDYQNELDASNSVVITDDGGYLISGTVITTTYRSLYIVRTDSIGDTLWTKQYKQDSSAYWAGTASLLHTVDGYYALGGSFFKDATNNNDSDGLLIKFDDNGDTLWTKTYGGIYWDTFADCLQNMDGTYMLAGATDKYNLGNNIDFYLVKTDSAGNMLWEKNYGGNGNERIYSFDHTPDGGYILAGYTYSFGVGLNDVYLVKVDSNGNQQWQKTFGYSQNDAGQVKTTKDGGYLLYGGMDLPGYPEGQAFIYRLDSAGNTIWNKTYGYSKQYPDYLSEAIELNDGSFVLIGFTMDSVPFYDVHGWILKVNANGDSLWSRRYKRDSDSYFYDVKETQDKGFAVTGFAWVVNGGQSAWLMKLDSMGCDTPGCNAVGIEEQLIPTSVGKQLAIYPNPANETVTFIYSLPENSSDALIHIYDMTGREIRSIGIAAGSRQTQLDVSNFVDGLYFLTLTVKGEAIANKKLMIAD